MSSPAPVNVACLGAGYFSQFHIDGWSRLEEARLVGLADFDTHRAQTVLAEHAGTETPDIFASLKDMLSTSSIDILDIIIPPAGHAEAISEAISHGVKTIICQKPFCLSLQQAEEMTVLAERSGAVIIIHDNFRFQPWYRVMKTAVEDGLIGTPMQMSFRLRPGDGQGPDAYLARQPYFQSMKQFLVHETAIHFLDVFSYLFGPVTSVYADLKQRNPHISGEDAGIILLEHKNGVISSFDGNRLLDHRAENRRLTMGDALIEGEGGSLSLSGDGEVVFRAFGEQQQSCLLEAQKWPGFGGDCVYALQYHVCQHIRHGSVIENMAPDYLDRLRLEQAVYQSAETGCKIYLSQR